MKKLISKIKWSVPGVFLPALAMAQLRLPAATGGPTDLQQTVQNVLNIVLGLAGLIAVIVIVIGGVFLITSGDPAKSEQGKGYIKGGIIGLIIVILAYAIVAFVMRSLGVTGA